MNVGQANWNITGNEQICLKSAWAINFEVGVCDFRCVFTNFCFFSFFFQVLI